MIARLDPDVFDPDVLRSVEGAQTFCRVRGCLLTCQRRGTSASGALILLFNGKLPSLVKQSAKATE